MITAARIEADLRPAGLDWITALRAPDIRALAGDHGPLQPGLFDTRDIAEITAPDYPGERLVVCRNPALAIERARKREDLLLATEKDLARIQVAVARETKPLRGRDKIGLRVGRVLGRRKMAKHIQFTIEETAFSFVRDKASIAREAALDGFYVIPTSVAKAELDSTATVLAYKSLAHVERAFRTIKTTDLEVRPIHHRLAGRVRAHVFLCMLAYYVMWHMRQALAPLLFDDHQRDAAAAARISPVAPPKVSVAARKKAASRLTAEGYPVHSFRTLLQDLATLARNVVHIGNAPPTVMLTRPTNTQQAIFNKLGISVAA
jgi:hypothetical protein